jgi:hypothetical protein
MPKTRKNYRKSKTQKRKSRTNRRKQRGGGLFNSSKTPAQLHSNSLRKKHIANTMRSSEGWTNASYSNASKNYNNALTRYTESW